jgi:predicted SAM-dependent methyltransferase
MSDTRYVHYGCGWSAPNGWKNYDASPTLRFERLPLIGKLYTKNQSRFPKNVEYGDIVKGLPIPDEECEMIYCSHILEHLSLANLRKALKNTYCKLRVGGTFRFVLPDLEYHIKKYIDDPSADAALLFMKEAHLGKERSHDLKSFLSWFGNSHHLWMWDYKSIERELRDVGFIKIRRAQFGDSLNLKFKDVEDKSRWDNCLGVECSK